MITGIYIIVHGPHVLQYRSADQGFVSCQAPSEMILSPLKYYEHNVMHNDIK